MKEDEPTSQPLDLRRLKVLPLAERRSLTRGTAQTTTAKVQ